MGTLPSLPTSFLPVFQIRLNTYTMCKDTMTVPSNWLLVKENDSYTRDVCKMYGIKYVPQTSFYVVRGTKDELIPQTFLEPCAAPKTPRLKIVLSKPIKQRRSSGSLQTKCVRATLTFPSAILKSKRKSVKALRKSPRLCSVRRKHSISRL